MLDGGSRVPRLAMVDFLDAWNHGRHTPEAERAIHAVFGAHAVPVSLGVGAFCGAITTLLDPVAPGDWYTWGQTLFAVLVGSRGWQALHQADDPEPVTRPLLASAVPGILAMIAVQLLHAIGTDPMSWLAFDQLPELGLHLLGQGTWSLVLLAALMASRRWLQTLTDLFLMWVFLYVSIGVGFWIVDTIGALALWLISLPLGWVGLGFVGSALALIDQVADLAFVAGALAWVAGGAWLTASEVLPARAMGSRISYVRSLKALLQETRR